MQGACRHAQLLQEHYVWQYCSSAVGSYPKSARFPWIEQVPGRNMFNNAMSQPLCTRGTEALGSTLLQRHFTPRPFPFSLPPFLWETPLLNQASLTKLGSLPCNVSRNYVIVL